MGNVITGIWQSGTVIWNGLYCARKLSTGNDPEPAISIHLSSVSIKYFPRIQLDVSLHLLAKRQPKKHPDQSIYPSPYHLHVKPIASVTSLHFTTHRTSDWPVWITKFLVLNGLFTLAMWGRDSSVGIATRHGLYGPGIESRWRNFPHPSRPALGPTQPPVQRVPDSFPEVKLWRWQSNSIYRQG